MITYAGKRAMLDEYLLRGFPLHISMLNTEQTRRSEQARGLGNYHPDHLQPVITGEQGEQRIVITCLGDHGLESLQRNIGRIGDHQVDRAVEFGQGADHVLHVQLNRRVREVSRCVGGSLFGQLDGMNPGPGEFGGNGFGNGATSGAELDDHWQASRLTTRNRVDHRAKLFDRPACHDFGLRPGYEDTGAYLKFQVAKVSPTGEVLQRHPMRAFVDQRLEVGGLSILDGVKQRKASQLDACRVSHQLPSLLIRRGDTHLAQLTCSLVQ